MLQRPSLEASARHRLESRRRDELTERQSSHGRHAASPQQSVGDEPGSDCTEQNQGDPETSRGVQHGRADLGRLVDPRKRAQLVKQVAQPG
ncbi:MAG: hypothetical protein QOE64_2644, partial [Frankiales bacterium]|nr:hypothetical protein [Frankiales bacterium]